MKKKVFSIVKAVRANARGRVGQPKPARVIQSDHRVTRKERRFGVKYDG